MDYSVRAIGAEADQIVVGHWRAMWLEVGIAEADLHNDFQERTLQFISSARDRLQYQTFVATDLSGEVVGSASCQRCEGPLPLVLKSSVFDLGTAWAIYVQPQHRRRGVGTRLAEHCVRHWKAIGCTRGILMYASDNGRRIYERLGFAQGNVLLLNDLANYMPRADTHP